MTLRRNEILFGIFFLFITAFIGFFFQRPDVAMWVGLSLAAYSAISNDSIQTLGTFLSSNARVNWLILWLFIGSIFILTMSYGWFQYAGDVSFERLSTIPHPQTFNFFQIFAPAVLLVLTKYRIPVSTTFLILSVFSTTQTVEAMLTKTLYGYVLAFAAAFLFWGILMKLFRKYFRKGLSKSQEKRWRIFQWLSTGFLWISWLMQDTANIAVFLPRQLSLSQFIAFAAIGFGLIGLLFFFRGGAIQSIVREKKDVIEVRAATLIDLLFAFILVYFKQVNSIPMSTTWVFLGLLAGREIILSHFAGLRNPFKNTAYLVAKDIMLAIVGLLVSILLVILARPSEFIPWIREIFLLG